LQKNYYDGSCRQRTISFALRAKEMKYVEKKKDRMEKDD
jgi:hypothetical protein